MFGKLFRYVDVKKKIQVSRGMKGIMVFIIMFNLLSVSVPQHHETIVKLHDFGYLCVFSGFIGL